MSVVARAHDSQPEPLGGVVGRYKNGKPRSDLGYALHRVDMQAEDVLRTAARIAEADELADQLLALSREISYLASGHPELDACAWVHRAALRAEVAYEPAAAAPPTRRELADRAAAAAFRRIGERDGYACRVCGTHRDLTVDHVISVANGGTDDDENFQLLCRSHNSSKGAR